jgi:hypothetical protein
MIREITKKLVDDCWREVKYEILREIDRECCPMSWLLWINPKSLCPKMFPNVI